MAFLVTPIERPDPSGPSPEAMQQVSQAHPVQSLQEAWKLFEEGIAHIYSRWTALTLAHQNAVTPQPNQTPYADLLAHTVDYFHTLGSKSAPATTSDIASIAEILAANLVSYFEDVFEVEVEDGSPYQIARTVTMMYQEIFVARTATRVVTMREENSKQASIGSASRWIVASKTVQDYQSDDDDNDEESDAEDVVMEDTEMAVDSPKPTKQPQGPIIDEDGFETVVRKKGGRRR
ncbi:hypothetical protein BASA50_004852 [Batrachochytrium salamandrivorans]|uniref:Pre-rRNA-processing protein TSR2 n=1 Tax=Batrachochytrium salamandrivorans TaxID=1357716 RepID=A0ABQ8FEB4_9FUNG|nr:hypothetical protein BASA60_011193 [Batrachochytrium salamandrivorans]KAH6571027.1 hypothetical protein BASA62_004076 [Batrachochytrium salamandrivorans]KAH6571268.1 hypothetical protein BASA62_003969 [Batrachochytrium salamandrivorans]KAH6596858.1 hypothetical protein BASA50_004852 [Batrachochytrium salamandrivorans]KAH6602055.1 hypothetical protein BASA61_001521 [Batrachochytrium salamandrivorans]